MGIAMNPETKECGSYQGGDEYASYILPEPWVVNYGDPIQDETGTHKWDGDTRSIESFCAELSFTYIPGNLGTLYGQRTSSPLSTTRTICKICPFALLAAGVGIGVLLFTKWKKKRDKTRAQP